MKGKKLHACFRAFAKSRWEPHSSGLLRRK